jgi:hypothetical protein
VPGRPPPGARPPEFLLSARIDATIATAASRELAQAGWTTPQKLADSTWEARAHVLNEAGYARYDERTATMLGQATDLLLDEYRGDLRQLRDRADRHAGREVRALQEFSGIGPVGANIFCREAQVVWNELYPFADERALTSADRLGLGDEPSDLQRNTTNPAHLARLVTALVRCDLAHDHDEILAAARR